MTKHVIWSNVDLHKCDWEDDYKEWAEENNVEPSEDGLCDWIMQTNDMYFDDERMNLNKETEGRIMAIADLGFWNGRKMGYKLLGHNVNECLRFEQSCDYAEFFCDRYDLKSAQYHHDGTHYITYREIRPEITSDQLDNFCRKIYNGKATQKDITRYTRSLRPLVKKVYGWE